VHANDPKHKTKQQSTLLANDHDTGCFWEQKMEKISQGAAKTKIHK